MTRLLFVGERRSPTAKRKGWTWKDGRLAAKPLFEALAAMGVDPSAHEFINLWHDDGRINVVSVGSIVHHAFEDATIVALGKRVSDELVRRKIDHVALVHPAARGRIRKRARYIAHVREKLREVV